MRAGAELRHDVVVGADCLIGAHCEVVRSVILGPRSYLGHFVYMGDSVGAGCVDDNGRQRLLDGIFEGYRAVNVAGNIKVLFIAGFGPIVRERATSRKLYSEDLGISFKEESGGYLHTEVLQGAKTFALWPLSQAAHSCFGNDSWPEDIPAPQAWLEFDVDHVENATADLESQGYRILVKNKKEPWGQIVTRLLSPEGLLVGITFTPSMREEK